ncbi:hypothetical protein [Vibrio cincinnatiensis]|jgi:hypothetical protein|uniref:hypothetical protein n=1 Tax=Vibrio cincinnatiensis TaxID=675 RepID=UPI0011171C78|nr:hypothetical protein [Vibrio cincinnatiensis]MCG3723212.1 hypothetical protein [Vibrio cincinnatiensis]MCG3731328.1 hypothetical protein [Vibrio cincinnatiensis]MCG3734953.1 hypothetical protein [Vibrio cincinnatiensis]MCG3738841.1 hypothetical protein [Vibrio cincinnatiensis]MCG3742305.1 hypothetical protein [Vibrio cincinnatiensis]
MEFVAISYGLIMYNHALELVRNAPKWLFLACYSSFYEDENEESDKCNQGMRGLSRFIKIYRMKYYWFKSLVLFSGGLFT